MSNQHVKLGSAFAALVAGVLAVSAQPTPEVVYDNTTTSLGKYYSSLQSYEFGDEITLAGFGSNAYLQATEIELSYTTPPGFSSINSLGQTKGGLVHLYALDGPIVGTHRAPGTELVAPVAFALQGEGGAILNISELNTIVPRTFAFTVSFSGLEGSDFAALDIYSPPTVGSSFNDFWVKEGSLPTDWTLRQIDSGATPANFYAKVLAVPEPSSMMLLLLGGAGSLGWFLLRRRS